MLYVYSSENWDESIFIFSGEQMVNKQTPTVGLVIISLNFHTFDELWFVFISTNHILSKLQNLYHVNSKEHFTMAFNPESHNFVFPMQLLNDSLLSTSTC